MFYCRETELQEMNRRYASDQFECLILYGRRRVGKTALINEFCKDKPTLFFSALNSSSGENLAALSAAIWLYRNPDTAAAPVYQSYEDALEAITELSRGERLVFVIDEYPYLAKAEKSISSRLQHIIDHVWQHSSLYLILCGSSMSFMEYQVLGYQSPLYGRRTGQFKINALTYREITAFYPHLSPEDQALLYGVTGGIPHYINKLAVNSSLDEALIQNLFQPSAYLFEEPGNLLKQELREPAVYNSVIAAIAGGASHSNEISTKVGLASGICSKYLRVLTELGILKKETPITEKAGKKTIYTIADPFFHFWYRFIPRNMSLINTGRIQQAYEKTVRPYLSDYMGHIFESICIEYLLRYEKNLPFLLREAGQWWGTDPASRNQVQIDIVGLPLDGNSGNAYLVGSCKYKNEKIGVDEFELLKSYASVFRKNGNFTYIIFSKSGFTQNLLELEKQGKVLLRTLGDLY